MNKITFILKKISLFFIILFLWISENCFALEEHGKLWLAINSQHTLSEDKKWLSFIYSQFRFISRAHPWQLALIEGGIGYQLCEDESLWLGYRWTGRNPYNNYHNENRLFQQIISEKKLDNAKFIFRTRLEEIQRTDQNQISLRFRERLALSLEHEVLVSNLFPFFYEELFFRLNKTSYTTNSFFSLNRLFLGFNLHCSKKTWWEIGYINEYILRNPLNTQNQMNHILSLTYNF